jgi:plasmid stability protein
MRAARHGRSIEAEAREILTQAVEEPDSARRLGRAADATGRGARSHVFLALVGPERRAMVTERVRTGVTDYVVKEIELALRRDPAMAVIPVLIDDTEPPADALLPLSIRELLSRHVWRIRNSALRDDVDA